MFYGIYAVYGRSEGLGENQRTSVLQEYLYFHVEDRAWERSLARVGGKKAQIPMTGDDLRREWEVAHPVHVISRALLDRVIASQHNKESLFQELTCPA